MKPGARFDGAALIDAYGSVSVAAQTLHVSRRTVQRWRRSGVPARAADRVAVAAGRHPAELWPIDWASTS